MINARMRNGSNWTDLCILNMSSRGLMGRSQAAPRPGSYVEVRRGQYVIVARVVWSDNQLFGVSTQDVLPIDDILENRGPAEEPQALPVPGQERRYRPRPVALPGSERSRQLARAMQFCFMVTLGCSVAVAGAATVYDALARPMETIAGAFDGGSGSPSAQSAVRRP